MSPVEGTLFVDIDIRGFIRPRAERARLRQAVAELWIELHHSPEVREVFAVVWTEYRPSAREMDLVTAAVEGVHIRAEMLRGTPLAVAVVFADNDVPVDRLRERGLSLPPLHPPLRGARSLWRWGPARA